MYPNCMIDNSFKSWTSVSNNPGVVAKELTIILPSSQDIVTAYVTNWWYITSYVARIGNSYLHVGDNSAYQSQELTQCSDVVMDGGFFPMK